MTYIEIEQGSNQKYEFNTTTFMLELDRVIPDPYVYPFAYGFILNTLADDGDELDMLILTNKPIPNNTCMDVFIIGVLIMEDEKGMDEKILCVLEEDYPSIQDLDAIDAATKDSLHDFFSNYKKSTKGKWSRVDGFGDKQKAIEIYKKSVSKHAGKYIQ